MCDSMITTAIYSIDSIDKPQISTFEHNNDNCEGCEKLGTSKQANKQTNFVFYIY